MAASVRYIEESDILYVRFGDGPIARAVERLRDIHIELDTQGQVVAAEVVGVSGYSHKEIADVFNEFGLKLKYLPPQPIAAEDAVPQSGQA